MSTPIQDFLKQAIEDRIRVEAKKEVEKAIERLEKKVPEIVAGIAVDIMSMTQMEDMRDRVVFTIKKEKDES